VVSEPPDLDDTARARWKAVRSAIGGLAQAALAGTLDEDGVTATMEQLRSIEVESNKFRDALHVLEGTGPYAARLEALLRRIPDGWGRWISCDAGWFELIVDLDAALSALDPDYRVEQVKEKFGTLRYYCTPSSEDADVWCRFDDLVRVAEDRSAETCERCGRPGRLCRSSMRWLKTLCRDCAAANGYVSPV
jgi:hypothetical protein